MHSITITTELYLTEMPVLPFFWIPWSSSTSFAPIAPLPLAPPLAPFLTSNTFQNFKFSSLLAVATVVPSGLRHECRILVSCAWGMSVTLVREG